jgi:hypothetical protein
MFFICHVCLIPYQFSNNADLEAFSGLQRKGNRNEKGLVALSCNHILPQWYPDLPNRPDSSHQIFDPGDS